MWRRVDVEEGERRREVVEDEEEGNGSRYGFQFVCALSACSLQSVVSRITSVSYTAPDNFFFRV